MRTVRLRRVLLALLVIPLAGAACLFTLAPRQYPCPAPLLTLLRKHRSVVVVVTQCLLSTDPRERVRDWYHTEPIGPIRRVSGFPAWSWARIRFSVYATLGLPPAEHLGGSAASDVAVMTQTSYALSWR